MDMKRYGKLNARDRMLLAQRGVTDMYFAVIAELLHESCSRPRLLATIFTGKTQRAAINKAQEWLIESTPYSREDWIEEHGAVRDDAHWLEIMEDNGFIVAAAKLDEDEQQIANNA
jgi:hypothetical protein